jgi:transcriptional regulator of met regulon
MKGKSHHIEVVTMDTLNQGPSNSLYPIASTVVKETTCSIKLKKTKKITKHTAQRNPSKLNPLGTNEILTVQKYVHRLVRYSKCNEQDLKMHLLEFNTPVSSSEISTYT